MIARLRILAVLLLPLLVSAVVYTSCGGDAVRRQAQAADGIARAFNEIARPAVVGAYEASCRAAIEAVCPAAPCDRAPMVAALEACEARWQPALAAYETARVAHGVWRATLMRCQREPDGGACAPDLARDGANVLRAVTGYRCAVRSLGRADLDPIPGTPGCTSGGDGG